MKLFSVAWGWTPIPEDMPEGDSLHRIADAVRALGFDGVDYLSTFESLETFFTPEKCASIRDHCAAIGLEIGGLVFQSDLWNNPDPAVIEKQMRHFEQCVEAANNLGARTISCIVPRPFGSRGPRGNASPSEKRGLRLPADYIWEEDWSRLMAGLTEASELAAERKITVALECFPGSLCSTPHAMLQAIEEVDRTNFGIQLDTAHLMNQNIDIVTAVHMLGGTNIKNVHLKDSDGLTRGNLPPGSGLVDYQGFFEALHHVGYTGNASIEVEFTDDPKRYMRQGLSYIRDFIEFPG